MSADKIPFRFGPHDGFALFFSGPTSGLMDFVELAFPA